MDLSFFCFTTSVFHCDTWNHYPHKQLVSWTLKKIIDGQLFLNMDMRREKEKATTGTSTILLQAKKKHYSHAVWREPTAQSLENKVSLCYPKLSLFYNYEKSMRLGVLRSGIDFQLSYFLSTFSKWSNTFKSCYSYQRIMISIIKSGYSTKNKR